jgi:hypothetical protein
LTGVMANRRVKTHEAECTTADGQALTSQAAVGCQSPRLAQQLRAPRVPS